MNVISYNIIMYGKLYTIIQHTEVHVYFEDYEVTFNLTVQHMKTTVTMGMLGQI